MVIYYDSDGERVNLNARYVSKRGEEFGLFTSIELPALDVDALESEGLLDVIEDIGELRGTAAHFRCDSPFDVGELVNDIVCANGRSVYAVIGTKGIPVSFSIVKLDPGVNPFGILIQEYADHLKLELNDGEIARA